MKHYIFCLVGFWGLIVGQAAWSQAFVVPSKMKFAGIDLTIDDNAKQQIQMRVNMLAQSPDAYRAYAERAQLYFPVIERVLEEERVPSDFKYVPLAESGLTADMIGRNNGLGFWLMTDTLAIDNGLVVNSEIDERKNIVTSTRAYSRYLQKCNYLMRNWFFSALAYPLGLNNSYMASDPNLRGATQLRVDDRYHPYFFNLLAHIVVFRDKLNLAGATAPTVQLLVYNDTKGKTLDQVAKMVNVPVTEMVKYNPWLTAATVPVSNAYPMLVPMPLSRVKEVTNLLSKSAAEAKGFVSTAASPNADQNTSQEDVTYPVIANKAERTINGRNYTFAKINGLDGMLGKEGYSIDEMAAVASLKPAKFMKLNDMKTGDYIKKDQVYYIVAKNKTGPVKDHVLLPGQSFADVSQQYGVQLNHINSLNRLDKAEAAMEGRAVRLQTKRGRKEPIEFRKVEQLTQEQKLANRVTEDNTMPSPLDSVNKVNQQPVNNEQAFHAVQPGETIYTISQNFGVLPSDLVRWNNLVGFNVEPGDLIRIKGDPAVVSNPLPNTDGQGTPMTNGQNWPNNEGLDIQGKNPGMMTSTLEGAKHVVQPGENLSRIAKKYNVTVPELMTWNGLTNTTPLRINQELALSGTGQVLNTAGQAAPQFQTHVVKKGETLSGVARKYGVTVGDLKTVNNLPNDMLSLNQKLKIGKAAMLNQPANGMNNGVAINQNNQIGNNQQGVINANPLGGNLPVVANTGMSNQPVVGGTGTYALSFGDSPYMVATKYGVAPEDVLRWNNLPADASAFPADMKVVYVADPTKVNSGATMGNALPQNNPNPGGGVFGNTPVNNTGANGVVSNAGTVPVPAEHVVNFGESPYSIAQKYNLSPADVLNWNKLAFDAKVQPGSTLQLYDPALGNQWAGTALNMGTNNQGTGISDPTIGTTVQGIQGTPVDIHSTIHKVQPAETLFGIARTYGVHVRDLYAWNGMNSESKLNSGQTIYIKQPPTEAATGILNQTGQGTTDGYYVTKAGDNVYGVARQFGVPVTDLKKWNGIEYGVIDLQPGTPLIINGKTAPIEPVTEAVYVSKPGDNIYKVASGFKIKVTDLKRWNNLAPGVIDLPVGTKLQVSQDGTMPQTELLPESGDTGTDLPVNGSEAGLLNQSAASVQTEEGYYTAQAGDNIYGVSSDHSITVLDLKKWNQIPTGKIDLAPGTKLIVSAAAAQKEAALQPKPVANKGVIAESANPNVKPIEKNQPEKKAKPVAAKKGAKTHMINRGETLSKIARDYKVTLKELRTWNSLKDSDDIQAGVTLKVSKE